MRGGCKRRIELPSDRAGRHLMTRSRAQRLTMLLTGPSVVRLRAGGDMPAAVRSRVALRAVADLP
jgi:hypothetical protein